MIGKGLESLIPKKHVPSAAPKESDDYTRDETILAFVEDAREMVAENPAHIAREVIYERKIPPLSGRPPVPRKHFAGESVFQIEIEKIKPNPYQPRKDFGVESLHELAQSIREFGVIQPLLVAKTVRETEAGTEVEYQLIAGERRLKAAKLAGLERVPAVVRTVDFEKSKLELALVENIQRRNLNPLETARAYARLQEEFNLTQREIAVRVGKSREAVANILRLLNLPAEVQQALAEKKISELQARTILAEGSREKQLEAFRALFVPGTTVRRESSPPSTFLRSPEERYWEKKFEETLGASVTLMHRGGKGKIVIKFHSEEEFRGITKKILGEITE